MKWYLSRLRRPTPRSKDRHNAPPSSSSESRPGALDGTPLPSGFIALDIASLDATARDDGYNFGAAQVPADLALGDTAAPNRYIAGVLGARKGEIARRAALDGLPARRRAATASARKAAAERRTSGLQRQLATLFDETRPRLLDVADDRRQQLAQSRVAYLAMPRLSRGYFESVWLVILIGVGVVSFDAGVLHGALDQSGMSATSLWISTFTIPAAIGATNHGIGVLAAAIGLRVRGRVRLGLAVGVLITALGALVLSFLLLTLFRQHAADAQNTGLNAIASGDIEGQLSFFLSPTWMGPLQLAGSFAAMAVTALWVAAKDGREFRELVLEPAAACSSEADDQVAQVDAKIAELAREIETTAFDEHEIEADARSAEVEIEVREEALQAALDSEDGLREAAQARFESGAIYHSTIGENGNVWRAAQPTHFPEDGDPYTPGACDTPVPPGPPSVSAPKAARKRVQQPAKRRTPPKPESNGHRSEPIDLNDITTA